MISVKEYLSIKLGNMAKNFPHVQIAYAYNSIAETHIVQLTPQLEYYNNKRLDNEWLSICDEFFSKYPLENISFVSDDSDLIHSKPELEFNKIDEGQISQTEWLTIYNQIISNIPEYSCEILSEFIFKSNIRPVLLNDFQDIELRYAENRRFYPSQKNSFKLLFNVPATIKKDSNDYDFLLSEAA